MGDELKRNLSELKSGLSAKMSCETLVATDAGAREQICESGAEGRPGTISRRPAK